MIHGHDVWALVCACAVELLAHLLLFAEISKDNEKDEDNK